MRVLVLHSRYLSGASSGENRVVEDEVRLLRQAGHRISTWTPSLDGQTRTPAAAARSIWSRSGRGTALRTALAERIDAVHAHNLFPNLSPAVLRTGRPTVMTLHNFRLACLSATFLRNGRICEDCLGRRPWRGVVHGCYRRSRPQSAVIATSLTLHHAIGTFDHVTLYAAVSEFVKHKLVEHGFDPDRIRVRRNFSWPAERRAGAGDYFLALGRLSVEKGLEPIVSNWRRATPLVVVGDGPERSRLESLASPGVRFCGAVTAEEVPALLRDARALLVPSTCYEGSPRVIVEALAAGVPVIASRIGGLPEHVDDEVSGLLVEPGNDDAWREAVGQLEDDETSERLGTAAYTAWQERFSPDVGLRSLVALYEEAIALAQADRA
jgi:glycosyltransferase involved in cell wall biosynthesis